MKPKVNPFATRELLRINYYFTEEEWQCILVKLQILDYRVAVVGAHGSGKTTFLECLAERLRKKEFQVSYFTSENSKLFFWQILGKLFTSQIIIVDGFQILGRFSDRILTFIAMIIGSSLIVSQHQATSLPVLLTTNGSERTLIRIINEMRLSSDLDRTTILAQASELFIKENANIRKVLLGLYDYCAGIDCEERTLRAD